MKTKNKKQKKTKKEKKWNAKKQKDERGRDTRERRSIKGKIQLSKKEKKNEKENKVRLEGKKKTTNGLFGLRGREGKQSRIDPKLVYFQQTLLYSPPLPLSPTSIQMGPKMKRERESHVIVDVEFVLVEPKVTMARHVDGCERMSVK